MNSDRHSELVSLLERINSFLADQLKAEPAYNELIETLELLTERIEPTSKPIVKIVSPSHVLATKLQCQNEANELLRSLYEFQIVSPISQIRQIVCHCDVICLLYNSTHKILPHHQRLIELAQAAEIPVFLLVHQGNSNSGGYTDWLTAQDYSVNDLELAFLHFIDLDNRQQVFYQRSLANFLPKVRDSYLARIRQAAKQEIERFFRQQIAHCWQEINQIKTQYLEDKQLSIYQQQFRQKINNNNQFRQQINRDIKQAINHAKTDLANPFSVDSFIFELQQIIDSAQVKTIKKPEHIYLYLVLEDLPNTPLFHDRIWDLCQQKAADILEQEWSKIIYVYGSGGLQALLARTNRDLSGINPLLDNAKLASTILFKPTLNLTTIVDYRALEFNSRIIFDYSYLQSSWFRLLISVLIGLAIYLFTLFFFGEGRYFGFLIIIFQIINLITGQNIKKAKLKQHTKELKRIVDQRYQSLVRIIINQIAQALILTTDCQVQQNREQWSEAIAVAQAKLDELKQTSDRHKSRIDCLQETRSTIQSWFN